ncbi:hypothetical protein CCR97_24215 [Rhodoplanes elegans]|uniref:Uncharacterized protein n=1 Tax=Rhodoplanes elegans TaxID=29408 RepID=A0A327KSV0_9BRAD|nr:hypothetical protein [Rhodoplanes elegans]MBK5961286.1 hypothetical protein [Rhodoplanes elegans]RAI41919.1 hypothetical protein CH338_01630 [Rhodoplanes elegans]
MPSAIFLSASVPDPKRSPKFAETADTVAINAAVSALVYVTLGRRLLVWGGHPAITPMICVVAEDIGVDYGSWVKLYQSLYFKDEFPEDNARFQNVSYVDEVPGDREGSLRRMREKMFSDFKFSAAVFIGGMQGIIDEYELFKRLQPDACVFSVASTGGAALGLPVPNGEIGRDLAANLDYVAVFHRSLGISVREERFRRPDEQPARTEDRFWRPSEKR